MNARASAQLEAPRPRRLAATRKVRTLRVAAQQQVEIAKALTLNAELLIFDEPTAALGGEETELLFEQIRKLKAEGMSFIYISHRLDEIAQIADRIVVMRDGRIVARHETRRRAGAHRGRADGRPQRRAHVPAIVAAGPTDVLLEVEGLSSPDKRLQRRQLLGARPARSSASPG